MLGKRNKYSGLQTNDCEGGDESSRSPTSLLHSHPSSSSIELQSILSVPESSSSTESDDKNTTIVKMSKSFTLWLALLSITFLVIIFSVLVYYNTSSKTAKSASSTCCCHLTREEDLQATTTLDITHFIELKSPSSDNINNNTSSTTTMRSPFRLFYDSHREDHLYALLDYSYVINQTAFLWVEQLVQGIGDRSIMWDAGSIIHQDLVCFYQISNHSLGLKVLSSRYHSTTDLITRSFAHGNIFIFDIIKHTNNSSSGSSTEEEEEKEGFWVNMTEIGKSPIGFIHSLTDLNHVIQSNYGNNNNNNNYHYQVVEKLSFIDHIRCSSNSLRAYLTSNITYQLPSSTAPSRFETILPSDRYISLAVRRTLLTLPPQDSNNNNNEGNSYVPRLFHPNSGFNYLTIMNEDADLFERRSEQYILRHRLYDVKTKSILPLKYYVDSIIPEPIRSAIVEGVSWWDIAFQAAGYPAGTFTAEIAPPDFDPYDFYAHPIHYVQWIDRDLRYYSVGIRVIDPRTGEIIRGHARLEGLRMRQDTLLLAALLAPYNGPNGEIDTLLATQMKSVILERAKHLGAHEVGHTLGLAHNFAGSTYRSGYASVMDYPPPLISLSADEQELMIRNTTTYSAGIGFYDQVSISYGYKIFSSSTNNPYTERDDLNKLLVEKALEGYLFVTDDDSGQSGSDWKDTKWDEGTNPIKALNNSLKVRQIAMNRFGQNVLSKGSSSSRLLEALPIIYLWHRYEIEAAAKLLGGRMVQYSQRGDGLRPLFSYPQPAEIQRAALQQLLVVIQPDQLEVPHHIQSLSGLSASFGFEPELGGSADIFNSRLGRSQLDPIVLLESLSAFFFNTVLEASRLERLFIQSQYNSSAISLNEVLRTMADQIFHLDLINWQRSSWSAKHLHFIFLHVLFSRQSLFSSVSYLVDNEIQKVLNYISTQVDNVLLSGNCVNISDYCQHCQGLKSALNSRKPFLNIFSLPDGPPI